jgi:hypothetical protein
LGLGRCARAVALTTERDELREQLKRPPQARTQETESFLSTEPDLPPVPLPTEWGEESATAVGIVNPLARPAPASKKGK